MPKFSEKMGILQIFLLFQNVAKKIPPINILFHIDWNHIFHVKVQQKIANKKNTLDQNICPTVAQTLTHPLEILSSYPVT